MASVGPPLGDAAGREPFPGWARTATALLWLWEEGVITVRLFKFPYYFSSPFYPISSSGFLIADAMSFRNARNAKCPPAELGQCR